MGEPGSEGRAPPLQQARQWALTQPRVRAKCPSSLLPAQDAPGGCGADSGPRLEECRFRPDVGLPPQDFRFTVAVGAAREPPRSSFRGPSAVSQSPTDRHAPHGSWVSHKPYSLLSSGTTGHELVTSQLPAKTPLRIPRTGQAQSLSGWAEIGRAHV